MDYQRIKSLSLHDLLPKFAKAYRRSTKYLCSPTQAIVFFLSPSANGFLYIFDFSKVDKPRIILRERMHRGPVNQICFDQTGSVFCTCSTDGHVFVFSGQASRNFQVLGYAVVQSPLDDISAFYNEETDKIRVAAPLIDCGDESKNVFVMDLPKSILGT